MSGLRHYFSVIANNDDTLINNDNPNKAVIHDDIIQYIKDSLNWITAFAHCDKKRPFKAYVITALQGLINR